MSSSMLLVAMVFTMWRRRTAAKRRFAALDERNMYGSRRRARCRMNNYKHRRDGRTVRFAVLLTNWIARETAKPRILRSVWMYPRSQHWWTYIVLKTFTPRQWLENFRMSHETFQYLCRRLQPFLEKEDTNMRKSIPVDLKVGAVIWTLATQCDLRTVSHLFGISISSVCLFTKEMCRIIVRVLTPELICLPTPAEAERIMDGFYRRWGFPNCVGAIDGSHIPIMAPSQFHTDYYNRKCFYSYNIQAYVDECYHFRDVVVGWPGSVHDARILSQSNLYHLGESGELFPGVTRNVNGTSLEPVILGDPAYPLLRWLMKPFPDNTNTTQVQRHYNYIHSRNRMVIENAFGRLKGRWRRLMKRADHSYLHVPYMILACCTLHNLCEGKRECFPAVWHDEIHDDIERWRVPVPANRQIPHGEAKQVRDFLAQQFSADQN